MHSIPRLRFAGLFAATSLALAANGAVAPSAHADSYYCWASQCNGHDPYAEKCFDGKVINYTNITGYEVDDVYSAGCNANWAQVKAAKAEPFFIANTKGNKASYTSAAGGVLSWSNMVDGSVTTIACLEVPQFDDWAYDAIWARDNGTNGYNTNYPYCG